MKNTGIGVFFTLLLLLTGCSKENTILKSSLNVTNYEAQISLAFQPGVDANPMCMIDFDRAQTYNILQSQDSFGSIDMIWAARTVDTVTYIISPKVYEGSAGLGTDFSKLDFKADKWTKFNASAFSLAAPFRDEELYPTITNKQDLSNFISDKDINGYNRSLVSVAAVGKVFSFKTDKGREGIFQIMELNYGPKGYMKLDVKINP